MARKIIEPNIAYDDARKLFYLTMDLGRDENGRRQRQCRTFTSITAARTARRDFLAQQEQLHCSASSSLTLAQWLDCWMDTIVRPNRAETTAYAYGKIIKNHLLLPLGNIPLNQLSPLHIQTYYSQTQKRAELSSNTLRRHHDLLSSALGAAVRQGVLSHSPMDRVEPPRIVPAQASFYGHQELKRLYQLVSGLPLELPVKLAGSFGLRREEVCGLRWDCVDFPRRLIYIRQARTACGSTIVEKETKTRSSVRTLYIPDDMYNLLLKEHRRQREYFLSLGQTVPADGHVVLNRREQPCSPNALSLAFTRFIRRHGMPKITLHGLRHSFATIACVQGASLFDIGKALGHSTPSTTGRIYTHLVDHTHENTVLRVSNALK